MILPKEYRYEEPQPQWSEVDYDDDRLEDEEKPSEYCEYCDSDPCEHLWACIHEYLDGDDEDNDN